MKKYLIFLTVLLASICNAQNQADVEQNFGAYTGFDDSVTVIAIQNDGKILVGGWFSVFNGIGESRLIRLNADGSKDTSFDTGIGFNGTPLAIKIQNDGKILVVGGFSTYKGLTVNNIIRLNADGSNDTSFITGTGFNSAPTSIAIQSDYKIVVGGNFTTYNGSTVNKIIRLNSNGSKDTSFNTGTGTNAGFNNVVNAITLQNDNKIIVGGGFTSYKGLTENYIIRLNIDGSKDTSFITGIGFDDIVTSIVLQNDGKILVGGNFTSYKGLINKNKIVRLNPDGSEDISFITGTGFNSAPTSIAIQSDGNIIVGGGFTSYKGLTERNIIRLNTDGSKDTTFITGSGFNGQQNVKYVTSIAIQIDGKILAGGIFDSYKGKTEKYIIRLNSDGSKHTSFNTGDGFTSGGVFCIAMQNDGKLLLGGKFSSYKGLEANNIIRINSDGSIDSSFVTGNGFINMPYGSNFFVSSIAIQSDGKIIVGGFYNAYQGTINNHILRLNNDGSIDNSFNTQLGFNQQVGSIAIQNDGKIIVGGSFTSYKGLTENYIIRLNIDGSKDTSFLTGTGFNNGITNIVLQNDGKILVGGYFTSYDGLINNNRIIRLNTDGSKDTSFITGFGFNGNSFVSTIVLQNDGKILVGGNFTSYDGLINNNRIIRLNTDGSKDYSFFAGTGFDTLTSKIALQSDGKILIGGWFTTYKDLSENRIIRLNTDGSKDTSFITGTGFKINNVNMSGNWTKPVRDIVVQNDGKILVGGDFYTYNDINASSLLIKLYGNSVLETENFNESQVHNIFPNPAKDQITIDFGTNSNAIGGSYKILNMLGQEVQNGDILSQQNIIQLSNIKEQGIYFVKIFDNSNEVMETKKIIIQ